MLRVVLVCLKCVRARAPVSSKVFRPATRRNSCYGEYNLCYAQRVQRSPFGRRRRHLHRRNAATTAGAEASAAHICAREFGASDRRTFRTREAIRARVFV